MAWTVNDKEFSNVVALPPPRRYAYFLKRVVDFEKVWSLGDEDGWALSGDPAGQELVPVWPHPSYAMACALGPWANREAKPILLSEWLEKWLPGMTKDGRGVAVFPTPDGQGIVVTPERLRDDLLALREEWYGATDEQT